nr:DUF2141 domain-containing protein [Aequorivita vitellina]
MLLNPTPETHTLTINITDIENVEGTLEVAIFNTNERFLEEGQALKTISVKVKAKSQTVVFTDLPKGNYAVSMYHDENSDGKCNRNFMGIPKEPYGFSNNFRPKFSAPTFQDCQFYLAENHTMKISLKG